jgi:hypothetical protein
MSGIDGGRPAGLEFGEEHVIAPDLPAPAWPIVSNATPPRAHTLEQ